MIYFKVILFLFLPAIYFAQSKKEQIESLKYSFDSIDRIKDLENQGFNDRKKQLENAISDLNNENMKLEGDLKNVEQEIDNKQKEIINSKENFEKLKFRISSLEDSINKLIEKKPLTFLDSNLLNISDGDIIEIMGINSSILDETFSISEEENQLPTFSVLKKNVFIRKGKIYAFVFVGVENPNYVFDSQGNSFLGLLENNEGKWSLVGSIRETGGYNYGNPADLTEILNYGKYEFAFVISTNRTHGGTGYEFISIYGVDEAIKIVEIFSESYDTYFDPEQYPRNPFVSKEVRFQCEKSTNRLYDITVIEELTDKNDRKSIKKKVLKYNSIKGIYQ